MQEDMETQLQTIDFFAGNVLSEMRGVTKQTTKKDMLAHIEAWINEIQTIKYIINL